VALRPRLSPGVPLTCEGLLRYNRVQRSSNRFSGIKCILVAVSAAEIIGVG
jgi:hypothetical protein